MAGRGHRIGLLWTAALLLGLGCDDGGSAAVRDAYLLPDGGLPDASAPPTCARHPEICNGRDDDCDGLVDEDDPDMQLALLEDPLNCGRCGHDCAAPHAQVACQAGECRVVECAPGFGDYNGDTADGCEADCVITAGGHEICDGVDNDCDGLVDEDFDLQSDLDHCGACGHECGSPAFARPVCEAGACALAGCARDHYDLNGEPADGCEYACERRSTERVAEFCNGLDDDCDGQVDEAEDLRTPEDRCGVAGVCAPECAADADCPPGDRCNGGQVCVPTEGGPADAACETDADCQAAHPGFACLARTTPGPEGPVTDRRCAARTHAPQCDGLAGYRCTRPPSWRFGDERGLCDGLDNDCDGRVDEDFVEQLFLADQRSPRPCTVGDGICQRAGVMICAEEGASTTCSARAGEARAGPDDDCDGLDQDCDGQIDQDFIDAWVGVGDFEIYAYEASRPGATAQAAGRDPRPDDGVDALVEARACSRAQVQPWAEVDWAQASAACEAAGARLCTGAEWQRACGGAALEAFPYGGLYDGEACNGGARDADPEAPGRQDAVLPTGSLMSCARQGVFDLSGNLKEWTDDAVGALRPVRGGGFQSNLPGGLTCGQSQDLKAPDFRGGNIGFRCCRARP